MKTLVDSQFGYCLLIWMFHSRKLNSKINNVEMLKWEIVHNMKIIKWKSRQCECKACLPYVHNTDYVNLNDN